MTNTYLHILKQALYKARSSEKTAAETRQWALQAYAALLRGGYLNADCLAAYPFLKRLSEYGLKANDADDFFPDDSDFEYMVSVLDGSRQFAFSVNISIPPKMRACFAANSEIGTSRCLGLFEKAGHAYQALMQGTPLCELWDASGDSGVTGAFLPSQLMQRVRALTCRVQDQSAPECFARQFSLYAPGADLLSPEAEAKACLEALLGRRTLRVFFQLRGTQSHYLWTVLSNGFDAPPASH